VKIAHVERVMTDRVRVGVVGTGWWATQFHLPALLANERAQVVALADRDGQRLVAAGEAFGIDARYTDHRELLASGAVDAVLVVVPHNAHFGVARDALEAGVHVMLEKPMTLRAADAWTLVSLARDTGLHLQLGYTYQFTRHALRAKQMFDGGELGDLLLVSGLFASMVESYYRGRPEEYAELIDFPLTGPAPDTYSDPAISGGGQAIAQITHAMGMVHWLTGARAEEVFAFMANRDLAVDLADAISYRLDGGAIGTMSSTGSLRPRQPQQQELRYYGTEGFLLQEIWAGKLEIHRNDGSVEVVPPLAPAEIYPAGAPSAGIVDLVLGTGENLAPPEPAAAAAEFLELAYISARERRPVRRDEL
jgi:predicted dehydrogenase